MGGKEKQEIEYFSGFYLYTHPWHFLPIKSPSQQILMKKVLVLLEFALHQARESRQGNTDEWESQLFWGLKIKKGDCDYVKATLQL